jgi:lipopolysaccharide/colanic/teichoic acid biosynthesis glycosyltransferase
MYFAKDNKSEKLGSDSSTRVLDILGGVVCLIFFAPLILVVFLLLKADGGPVFIGHKHTSSDGRPSTLWRFRARSPGRPKNVREFLSRSRIEILPEIYNVAQGDLGFFEMLGDV